MSALHNLPTPAPPAPRSTRTLKLKDSHMWDANCLKAAMSEHDAHEWSAQAVLETALERGLLELSRAYSCPLFTMTEAER